MNKSVSLIMVAYNEQATIATVINKLKSIDFFNEIIIVDNGSTDSTNSEINISSKDDDRIKIIKIQKNKGLGYGLKKAIKNTTGDIVVR